MVELAGQVGGVFGARMTGGGFGGSTVNLVDRRCVENFQISVSSAYKKSTGLDPQILVSSAAAGAAEVMASTAADDFISSNSDSR
jgi:galactokinase